MQHWNVTSFRMLGGRTRRRNSGCQTAVILHIGSTYYLLSRYVLYIRNINKYNTYTTYILTRGTIPDTDTEKHEQGLLAV